MHNHEAVNAAVNAAFADLELDDLLARLAACGVPAGEVRRLDRVYAWEQTRSQGLLLEVEHQTLGGIVLPGPPLRFDGGARTEHLPPPTLGQHNESVRAWLDEIEAVQPGRRRDHPPELGRTHRAGPEPG